MIVVFDTNAYRNVVSQKNESESKQLIENIKNQENSKEIIPMMSSTVAMELIKHLHDEPNSRSFKSCSTACKIMYEHTGNSEQFRLLPLPETQLAKIFFKIDNKKALQTQKSLGVLLYELTKNLEESINKYSTQISEVANFMNKAEQVYVDGLNSLCKQIDPSFVNWPPFQNNEKKRSEFLNYVKSNSFQENTAIALLSAVEHDLIKQGKTIIIPPNIRSEQVSIFIDSYKIPLNFRSWVWSQFVNGDFNPEKKSRANYIWDEYILHFADKKANNHQIMLVTCDNQMIGAAKRVNKNCLIKTFDEYLKFIGVKK